MARNFISIAISFVLGFGLGSLAFGQRSDTASQADLANVELAKPEAGLPKVPATGGVMSPTGGPISAATNEEELPGGEVIEVEIGAPNESAGRLPAEESRWSSLSTRLDRLSRRVIELEQRLADRAPESDDAREQATLEPLRIDTPDDRRSALVFAGVDRRTANDIVSRESELAMERLNLRDRAAREGWLGSERFAEEMSEISQRAVDLRDEVGDAAFDRFLYETGQPNRVAVSSVLAGSQGELAGILPGDIIENYAGEPVFDLRDLRSATTAGARDEPVPVTIRRDDRLIETWMARGPIGVTLQSDSANPDW